MPSSGIVLALDTDEAGQKSTEASGLHLLDLFGDWGEPRYPGEPTSHAVAHVQRAIDDVGDEIKALEAVGASDERLAQSVEMRILSWDYMTELMRDEKETVFTHALSAEELEHALVIEATPILPSHTTIDYAAIKGNVDIVSYIERDTNLRHSGRTFRGRCSLPGHEEKTGSLYVYPDTRSFYCFGCNRGGDVIEYARLRGVRARDIA